MRTRRAAALGMGVATLLFWASGTGCGDDDEAEPQGTTTLPAGGTGPGGSTTTTTGSGAQGGGGSGQGGGAAGGAEPSCRPPAAPNRERAVIVSRPYDVNGDPAATYELLRLSEAGVLSRPGVVFELERTTVGVMAFTPDGEIGIVAQPQPLPDSPSLGIVRIDPEGELTVIEASFPVDCYPESVVMDPSGMRAYVLDSQWRNNGGGVYVIGIGCDDTITDEGQLFESKLPDAMAFLPGDPSRVLLAATDAFASPADLDAHLLAWGDTPSWLDGTDAFPDNDAIRSSLAVMPDGLHALIGDNSEFSGVPTRVGVVRIEGDELSGVQVLTPIEDPYDIVASPYGNAALVVSGYGNDVIVLSYDPDNTSAPFAVVGAPTYQGSPPELPANAVQIERGDLTGLVLVSEVSGVRPFRFQPNGSVEDLGRFDLGEGLENMVGSIGVQP